MKYQLITFDKGNVYYLYQKKNGEYNVYANKYITTFDDYETASKVKEELSQFDLEICDENSKYFVFESRYKQWKRKIADDDSLYSDKTEALDSAVDLFYSDEVLEQIVNATTEYQIYNALKNSRLAS